MPVLMWSATALLDQSGQKVHFWPGIRSFHPVPVQWESLAEGFDRTVMKFEGETWTPAPDRRLVPRRVELVVFRIDMERFYVRVVTAQGLFKRKKAKLSEAHKRVGAALTLNGGYFNHSDDPLGLVVSDSKVWNKWTQDGGSGALAVYGNTVRIGWASNVANAEPPPDQALQNGPLIIEPGRKFGMMTRRDKYFSRTVMALDKTGRLLVAVTRKLYGEEDSRGGLNLFEVATILYNPKEMGGLEATVALNMDGGTSTGMELSLGEHRDRVRVGIGLPNFVCIMPPKEP